MDEKINSYRDLIVWQKSVALVVKIYEITKLFPRSEIFGLTNQMRRAAVSIPSNISEGYGRRSRADYKRFLSIASGSCYELETQAEISNLLGFINEDIFRQLRVFINEISKMLSAIIAKLSKDKAK